MECHPDFRLYLVTHDLLELVPPTLFSVVTAVEFQPERKGVEELLLDSFLKLQNEKTYSDREELRRELHIQSTKSEEVEGSLLKLIARQESGQIEDPKSIKSILALNKAFEDSQERYTHKNVEDNDCTELEYQILQLVERYFHFHSCSYKKALTSYTKVNKVHLSLLRSLASQASVITDVVLAMGSILPAYRTSYGYVKAIFVEFVKQTGRYIYSKGSY